eukprot:jgi/Bigna1/142302/aug1.69_g17010
MHQQTDESVSKDLSFPALDQVDALRSSWGRDARSVLHRIIGCNQPARGFDEPKNPDQTHPKLVDLDPNRRVGTRPSTNENLRRGFCLSIKPDAPISESRAWAKSQIGRPASRSFEHHLDDWCDNSGVLLKLQFRAGTCETRECRAETCNLPPSSLVCPLCNDEVVQSVNHLIHHCTHSSAARNKLFSSVRAALGPASPACSSFFDAPDSFKTKVLLGAPSEDLNMDRRADVAFGKFLIGVDALRHRHIAASCSASQWHTAKKRREAAMGGEFGHLPPLNHTPGLRWDGQTCRPSHR